MLFLLASGSFLSAGLFLSSALLDAVREIDGDDLGVTLDIAVVLILGEEGFEKCHDSGDEGFVEGFERGDAGFDIGVTPFTLLDTEEVRPCVGPTGVEPREVEFCNFTVFTCCSEMCVAPFDIDDEMERTDDEEAGLAVTFGEPVGVGVSVCVGVTDLLDCADDVREEVEVRLSGRMRPKEATCSQSWVVISRCIFANSRKLYKRTCDNSR